LVQMDNSQRFISKATSENRLVTMLNADVRRLSFERQKQVNREDVLVAT
jgi:hypothetical protein